MDYNAFMAQLLQFYGGIMFIIAAIQLGLLVLGCWVIYMFYARLRDIADELIRFRIAYEFAHSPEARSTPHKDQM